MHRNTRPVRSGRDLTGSAARPGGGPRAKRKRPAMGQYIAASAIGIEVGAALGVGMGIGWLLDRLFHTQPWLLVIFTGFGVVTGFVNMVRSSRDRMREVEGDGKGGAAESR